MKERMREILDAMHRYNSPDMALQSFGLDPAEEYDVLVVAPSFLPEKILERTDAEITLRRAGSYIRGYEVEKDGKKIAWIITASGAGNLIDHVAICGELRFKKLLFIGAVGALTERFTVGDLCTPECSIAGVYANRYLESTLGEAVPFERVEPDRVFQDRVLALAEENGIALRPGRVFCTESIALEYLHLPEILDTGAELIEMETSSFARMAELLEVPAAALLVVSDNSATGQALVGRTEEEQQRYDHARQVLLPELIFRIAAMESGR